MRNALCMVIVMTLMGCATVGKQQSAETISKVKEGQTTRAEVLELMGQPNSSTTLPDGREMLMYHYVSAKSGAQNFIPIVSLVQSRMDTQQQMIQVYVRPDGIIDKMTVNNAGNTMKYGIVTE